MIPSTLTYTDDDGVFQPRMLVGAAGEIHMWPPGVFNSNSVTSLSPNAPKCTKVHIHLYFGHLLLCSHCFISIYKSISCVKHSSWLTIGNMHLICAKDFRSHENTTAGWAALISPSSCNGICEECMEVVVKCVDVLQKQGETGHFEWQAVWDQTLNQTCG